MFPFKKGSYLLEETNHCSLSESITLLHTQWDSSLYLLYYHSTERCLYKLLTNGKILYMLHENINSNYI